VKPLDIGIVSVVPSPYQRDIFQALAACDNLTLSVYYLEQQSPDSPWPQATLQPFEHILPGFWFSLGGARFHIVTKWPSLNRHQVIILNSLTSSLTQTYLRNRPPKQKAIFWAEPLRTQQTRIRRAIQSLLTSPINQADAIVAIGSWANACYQELFPSIPRFNIPYHCELGPFFQQPTVVDRTAAETVFLFCGQIIPRKGVDILIRSFDALIRAGLPARLLLVGRRADLDRMLGLASPATRERISYQGFVDPIDLPELFAKAHVFVLPSRHDGWGVVVNQAIAAGLPVICTDAVGAGLDLVKDGVNGFRIPADDTERLIEAMKFFIEDRQSRSDFGAASRTLAEEWTPQRGAEKWLAVLRKVLVQDAHPAGVK
jgi:glycosyltransferase involved in cell wall biosynthesis